ncbi:hypothetical protein HPT25_14490 [Bacillus sp. BRMEA1]|uniref:hypothetical protein n=1 Tax=Neobacillus endophyticus TaxID=2738405 RepID=UPI0015643866|nr:hypothetical protein [Neobacillus endophyticus]NRD78569.1 hypothetical protein [Neobacillus endophyticus]
MIKQYLILLGFILFAFTPLQTVKAESVSNNEEQYFTTEDIVREILSPIIDKRLIKEYGYDASIWVWQRIVGITYNHNHSYVVAVRVYIPFNDKEDLVKLRISLSCDSEKNNELKCNRGLNIDIVEYKHLSHL